MRFNFFFTLMILLLACLLTMSGHPNYVTLIPQTNIHDNQVSLSLTKELPTLEEFSASIFTGDGNTVAGIYVPGEFAFPVIQQPENDPGFVSNTPDRVTEFSLANQYNTLGLLAHAHLAGEDFSGLSSNQPIIIIYGDGRQAQYSISRMLSFRALSPNSTQSSFEDLQSPGKYLSAAELFDQTYGRPGKKLILQTCIPKDGISTWGRLFIIASPQLTR